MCHVWIRDHTWTNTSNIETVNGVVRQENIGAIVLLAVVSVLGTIGNIPVLFVFSRRFKHSAYKLYVISLALTNLITAFLLIPGCILFLTHPLLEFPEFLCKFGVACFPFFAIFSGFILFMIAIDRYRTVCCSEGWQFTGRSRRAFFVIGIMLSFTFSLPMIFIYENVPTENMINNITTKHCFVSDFREMLAFHMNISWTVLSVCNTITLILLYTLIIRVIVKKKSHFRHFETFRLSPVSNKALTIRKSTITLFSVTVVSMAATIPSNIIGIYINSEKHYDCDFSLASSIILRTLLWFRLISPAVNPFVYGFTDQRFRREIRRLCRKRAVDVDNVRSLTRTKQYSSTDVT